LTSIVKNRSRLISWVWSRNHWPHRYKESIELLKARDITHFT
jgi:hypothetical protein